MFQVVLTLSPKPVTYALVDAWVLGNLVLSFISVWIVQHTQYNIIWNMLLIYGMLRVFEVIVYQINVLLFDEYRARKTNHTYSLRSYRRTVLLLLHNFVEIIFWFATSYKVLAGSFTMDDNSMIGVIYNSFVVMTSFGSTDLHPISNIGLYILWGQSIAGLFLTLISLARFIGLLPSPKTQDEYEKD